MSIATDLSGQRFGSLLVVERAGTSRAGNVTWWCRCACGLITRSAGSDLRRGRTRSCGYLSQSATQARHAEQRADLVDRRFGRLVVLEFAGLNSYPRATWRCKCDCGNEKTLVGQHLTDGTTVSCGCMKSLIMSASRSAALKDITGYTAAHGRVKRLHGSAAGYRCVDCDGQAEDWSYNHADPGEHRDNRGRPYSMTVTQYQPRCRSCHHIFDLRAAAATRKTQEGVTA